MKEKRIRCEGRSIDPWRQSNAMQLAHTLRKKEGEKLRAERFSEVGEWLRSCEADVAIISAETFYDVDPEFMYQTLAEHCPDYVAEARVIAYVRPHLSRALAAFTQRVKTGGNTGGFEKFKKRLLQGSALDLDYTSRFARWQDRFGDKFTLRPYVRSELRDQDVVRDFFSEVLGDVPFTLKNVTEANVGVTSRALSGLLLVQRHLKKAGLQKKPGGKIGGTIANRYFSQGTVRGEKPLLDRSTAEALAVLCKRDAQALDKVFFDRPIMLEALEKDLAQASDAPVDLSPRNNFTEEECKALATLSDKLCERLQEKTKIWILHENIRRGQQRATLNDKQKLVENQAVLEEIDGYLSDIGGILRG